MKLLLYLILFLIPTITVHSMELDLNDEDSDIPEEQQEKKLKELARAAAKRNREKRRQKVIIELTKEEEALLNPPNYQSLASKINANLSPRATNQDKFIQDIFLEFTDLEDMEEISLEIPKGHFVLCFYTQLDKSQQALLAVSPNFYLTATKGEYDFFNNPYKRRIQEFLNAYPREEIKQYAQILVATNIDLALCQKTEDFFSNDTCPSNFYFYDLSNIKSQEEKQIKIKLYKDLTEYVSFCSIQDLKQIRAGTGKAHYIQGLSSNPILLQKKPIKKLRQ